VAPARLTREDTRQAYKRFKALGAARPHSTRTSETDRPSRTEVLETPNFLVLLNRALRDIVQARRADIGWTARGLLGWPTWPWAMPDQCLGQQVPFRFLAAITAIQTGDNAGNPERLATDPPQELEPMINTPNILDYTSGANNVTGAINVTLPSLRD